MLVENGLEYVLLCTKTRGVMMELTWQILKVHYDWSLWILQNRTSTVSKFYPLSIKLFVENGFGNSRNESPLEARVFWGNMGRS